jgi:hypothetical protein
MYVLMNTEADAPLYHTLLGESFRETLNKNNSKEQSQRMIGHRKLESFGLNNPDT